METTKVPEDEAVKAIVSFVREAADLDDLAELYSRYIANGPVTVVGDTTNSDAFQDGKRIDANGSRPDTQ